MINRDILMIMMMIQRDHNEDSIKQSWTTIGVKH